MTLKNDPNTEAGEREGEGDREKEGKGMGRTREREMERRDRRGEEREEGKRGYTALPMTRSPDDSILYPFEAGSEKPGQTTKVSLVMPLGFFFLWWCLFRRSYPSLFIIP